MTEEKMSFFSHLEELRQRLVKVAVAIAVVFGFTFYFSEEVLGWLRLPLTQEIGFGITYPYIRIIEKKSIIENFIFLSPAENFWMQLKIAFFAALFLVLPFVLYQLWAFVAPGLFAKEKKFAGPFVLLSTVFFYAGAAFCFFFVLPFALGFLLEYKTLHAKPMLTVGQYFDFVMKFILAFGIVFELPLALGLLARMGIVTPKFLNKNRKYAILINFIIAAILTPTPDVFNQTLMAVPMCLLYEIGILAAVMIGKKKKEESAPAG